MAVANVIPAGEWRPRAWEDFAGNYRIVQYWKQMISNVRFEGVRQGFNALMVGESGSGKTATTEFGVKCLGCLNLDPKTLNACGKCKACLDKFHKHGHGEWKYFTYHLEESEVKSPINLHYLPLDCPRLTASGLERFLGELEDDDGFTQIVSMDEIHTLVRNNLDDKMLRIMEMYPVIWIGMSACINNVSGGRQQLEQMLINRFLYVLPTEKPVDYDFKMWTLSRCEDFAVAVDEDSTLDELASETNRVMRFAWQILTAAQNTPDRTLTKELVRSFRLLK